MNACFTTSIQHCTKGHSHAIRQENSNNKDIHGTYLVVQWVRLHAPNAGGPGLIPGRGTRSRMLQLRVCMPQLRSPHATTKSPHTTMKIPRAATKTWHSQNKFFLIKSN